MGNICRSPAAEGVFRKLVADRGLSDAFEIDSAGTIAFHAGELPDRRMRQTASTRGYNLDSRARPFTPEDFERFDLIVPMDGANLGDILDQATEDVHRARVKPMSAYMPRGEQRDVPDPYYSGHEAFDEVLDLLEVACGNLLDQLAEDGT
jgi:protein-tyrosine phosphatase